jgi:hypothetical protein
MWPGNEKVIRNTEKRFGEKIHNITYRYGTGNNCAGLQ